MSRIQSCFAGLKKRKRTALIPYITAGDPHSAVTVELMHAMVEAGADLIELGVPFSDPMVDGPVIQAANERALLHHVSMRDVLEMVGMFRQQNQETPVILMGYLNPIEVMGYEVFAAAASAAGVDGLLTVDIPPEESHDYNAALIKQAIDPIYLIAPTSTPERIQMICQHTRGFVYYVSLKGVTGAVNSQMQSVADKVALIRQYTDLPIGVGFGISEATHAAQVGQCADAVVVGSAIIRRVADNVSDRHKIMAAVSNLLQSMRQAMDR